MVDFTSFKGIFDAPKPNVVDGFVDESTEDIDELSETVVHRASVEDSQSSPSTPHEELDNKVEKALETLEENDVVSSDDDSWVDSFDAFFDDDDDEDGYGSSWNVKDLGLDSPVDKDVIDDVDDSTTVSKPVDELNSIVDEQPVVIDEVTPMVDEDMSTDVVSPSVDKSSESVDSDSPGVVVASRDDSAIVYDRLPVDEKKRRSVNRRLKKAVGSSAPVDAYRDNLRGLDSSIASRGAKEYLVNGDGVRVRKGNKFGDSEKFQKFVELAEKQGSVPKPAVKDAVDASRVSGDVELDGAVVYPWASPAEKSMVSSGSGNGRGKSKMNKSELDFFKRLNLSHKSIVDGEADVVRHPINWDGKLRGEVGVAVAGAVGGSRGFAKHDKSGVALKDLELLQFLAKFKYATSNHLSNLSGVKSATTHGRLVRLERKGLVARVNSWGPNPLWLLTRPGMLLSGFDLPYLTAGKLSYALIGHQFVVNNTASNLWGGGVNVLHLPEFPVRHRVDSGGDLRFGENVVSETEIVSSFSSLRGLSKADEYRPVIIDSIEKGFRKWREEGDFSLPSPEMVHGNEYMWMLFPSYNLGAAYHVPDLVVSRPRNEDGSPESIAVEVELNTKVSDKYMKTLLSYKADTRLFKKVIWVCKGLQPAKALEKVAKDIGLWQEDRIDIVPITNRDGIFDGRDLWLI